MTDDTTTDRMAVSRRRVLRSAGAISAVGLTGVAGCTGGGASGSGGDGGLEEITVAYMPIYPDMQYFIMEQEEYFDELSATVSGEVFSDGPSIVQASATGDFDVMMFGIVPAMIVMDKGIPSKITAANIQNAMQILAHDDFAAMWADASSGAEAFARFEEERGRKFTFGTFPPGSVPDILLRYWLAEIVGVDPETDVNVTALGGAGPVRQALLAGEIDGTSIMEPVPTIAEINDAPYQSIAWAGDFMPGQPAAVTLMHDRLREDNPEQAAAFVEQHQRATTFANENPEEAAQHASTVIGESSLPVETARRAMDSRASDFITDPHKIADGAQVFSEYAEQSGKTSEVLSNDAMFDFGVYDSL
ncbi:ABC transporter substrate-binding protein [Halobellus clavatus]|jgi:NitT/TauT family transport system substrate-binding protein|uniref:NitT/TauT family transport system substrate-binding protein n=1 Tax=Halobellus clavatus TaxID=660517 RepID=A0A1H3F8G2_9EURY|nr:ABC transporter substrate-binding protein [Halobellus clavatus]SDX87200.1 NitT/TauT family transport system substrate-binding protein [Halobellus clavatus]